MLSPSVAALLRALGPEIEAGTPWARSAQLALEVSTAPDWVADCIVRRMAEHAGHTCPVAALCGSTWDRLIAAGLNDAERHANTRVR